MNYRHAGKQDLNLLVESRLQFTYGMRDIQVESSDKEYEKLKEKITEGNTLQNHTVKNVILLKMQKEPIICR